MSKPKRTYVMVFQVESNHGSPQVVGRICYLNEEGELRNPLGDRYEEGAEYADFAVHGYVPQPNHDPEYVWGWGFSYQQPYRVETYRAEQMLKLLRRVDRGMEKLLSERGWPTNGDFHAYALRVAEVLGIKEFRVKNNERGRQISGEIFRRTDGSGVQSWIAAQVEESGVRVS